MTLTADADPARAAADAELAQAVADVVRQASQEVKLITRGDILATLVANGILASVMDVRFQGEDRDVQPPQRENVDIWLAAVLSSHPGIASFESLSGQTVYHAPDLLSRTYALILDRKGSPVDLMAGEIRANCRDYPRPVPVEQFESPPFELSPEEIQTALRAMAASSDYKDITFTAASTGAVYLFSTLHMERGYAAFLAERAESLAMNP